MKQAKRRGVGRSSYYPILSKSLRKTRIKIARSFDSRRVLVFTTGVFIGVTLALMLHHYQTGSTSPFGEGPNQQSIDIFQYFFHKPIVQTAKLVTYANSKYNFSYENWLNQLFGGYSFHIDPDKHRYKLANKSLTLPNSIDEKSGFIQGTEAHFLYNNIPVICVVFSPSSSKTITAVANTWGQHCNEIHFYYSSAKRQGVKLTPRIKEDKNKVLIYNDTNSDNKYVKEKVYVLDMPEAKSEFALFCRAFHNISSIYNKTNQQMPWILVAPEDSYILTENLRYYVAPMNQSKSLYLGHAMKYWSAVYNWASASFALNWVTLETLLNHFSTKKSCDEAGRYWKNGDWYLGKYLSQLGIRPEDTRDHAGRGRFNGYSMKRLLFPGGVSSFEKYWKNSVYGAPSDGPGCCSNFAVSFAGVLSRSKMHQQEYMHHHLRPFFGGGKIGNKPPSSSASKNLHPSLTMNEYLKEQARFNIFDPTLTTPKSMAKLLKAESGSEY